LRRFRRIPDDVKAVMAHHPQLRKRAEVEAIAGLATPKLQEIVIKLFEAGLAPKTENGIVHSLVGLHRLGCELIREAERWTYRDEDDQFNPETFGKWLAIYDEQLPSDERGFAALERFGDFLEAIRKVSARQPAGGNQ
jgi:hypothetical protein